MAISRRVMSIFVALLPIGGAASAEPAAGPGKGVSRQSPSSLTRLRRVVAEQLGVPLTEVALKSRLVADLGADSLDKVELVMALEDEFGVEIPDGPDNGCAADRIETVADAVRLVKEAHMQKRPNQRKAQ